MKTQISFQLVLVTAAMAASAAVAVLPVLAAEKTKTDVSTVTQNRSGIHPETANIAANSGHAMINHLRKVGVLLDTGMVADARSVLTSSRDYSRELQRLKERTDRAYHNIIIANKTEYAGGSEFLLGWVDIYSSLDEMEVYAPEVAEKTRERLKQAEKHATSGDSQRAAETLKKIAAEVPPSLQPGHDIDQQILLALELLEENQPDITTAKNVVKKTLYRLTVVVETTAVPSD
jgi:hypothetical protein